MAERRSIGWIRLHRKILDSDIWADEEPFNRRSAWLDLLLTANHKDRTMIFDGHKIMIQRGQILTSVRKLSTRWNRSVKWTMGTLNLLEELEMIKRESDNRKTVITIVNYGKYQDMGNTEDNTEETLSDTQKDTVREHSGNTEGNAEGNAKCTQTTNNNNVNNVNNNDINNDNNGNNDNNTKANKSAGKRTVYYPTDELLNDAFSNYVEMRKKIKAPMTDTAIDLAIKKLDKMAGTDNDRKIEILNQSVMNSWKGLFDLPEEKKDKLQQGFDDIAAWVAKKEREANGF